MQDKLSPPSAADLFGLVQLFGGNEERVIAYLAQVYDLPPHAIQPTVHQWLEQLPAVPPPSRQRSAPPVLAPPVPHAAAAASSSSAINIMPIRTPPASAPAHGSADLVRAMRALDSRMNHSTRVGRQPARLSQQANFEALLPPSVPENAMFGYEPADQDAAAAYLQREALVHGRGKLEPTSGMARDAVASTWMTRAVAKPRF